MNACIDEQQQKDRKKEIYKTFRKKNVKHIPLTVITFCILFIKFKILVWERLREEIINDTSETKDDVNMHGKMQIISNNGIFVFWFYTSYKEIDKTKNK